MNTEKWFKKGFLLLTTNTQGDGSGYRHMRLSVCRLYDGAKKVSMDGTLPSNFDHPTEEAETLLTMEFQQHRVGVDGADEYHRKPGIPLVQAGQMDYSSTYGGKLDTGIRIEAYGVDLGLVRRLEDIDRAIKKYNEKMRDLGAQRPEDDMALVLMALKSVWRLPALMVIFRGQYKTAVGVRDPGLDTDARRYVKQVEDREAEALGKNEES